MVSASFGADQFAAFSWIVQRESGWSTTSRNSSSGAYGLGQALPGSKMAAYGPDWQTNAQTQLNWMISYISARYSTPDAAMQHHLRYGWY